MKNDRSNQYEWEEKREKRRGLRFWFTTLIVGVVVLEMAYTQYLSVAYGTTVETISIADTDSKNMTVFGVQVPTWLSLPFEIGVKSKETESQQVDIKDILQSPLRNNQAMISGIGELRQDPELPAGCEATALTIVLNQMGYNADKVDIVDNYMPKGDNVAISYVGNPREEYGGAIYAPGLALTAEKYLNKQGAEAKVYDLWDMSFTNLCKLVAAGYPVIVWSTLDNEEPFDLRPAETYKGRSYNWYTNQHCVVFYGYDLYSNIAYISDPKAGLVQRNAVQFDLVYTACGMNAMAIIQ